MADDWKKVKKVKDAWKEFKAIPLPGMPSSNPELEEIWYVISDFDEVVSGYVGSLLAAERFSEKEKQEIQEAFQQSYEDCKTALASIKEFNPSSASEKKEVKALADRLEATIKAAGSFM